MDEKLKLFNTYKHNSTEWEVPRTQIQKDFALELVIEALNSTYKKVRMFK